MPYIPKNIELYIDAAKKIGLTAEIMESGNRFPLLVSNKEKFAIINTKSPGFYPNVSRMQATLTGNKILTQTILKRLGYKTIETELVKVNSFKSTEEIIDYTNKSTRVFPVLLKPNFGGDGKNICIVSNTKELREATTHYYKLKKSFLFQPIISQPEYRILVVNNEVQLVHSKANQFIVGNGKSTISELLSEVKNDKKDDVFIEWQHKKHNLSPSCVLEAGKHFEHHLARNPSTDYYCTKDFDPDMERWALDLAKKLSAPVLGIDVFVPGSLSETDSYTIIELNSNPAIYYLPARCNDNVTGPRIAEKVLRDYFNIKK